MNENLNGFHIKCTNELGNYCILTGDPKRVELFASKLQNPIKNGENREFITYTGFYKNKKITISSTGIGGPSAAIAMEELISLGVTHFIRVGTCGGIDQKVKGGDAVIAMSAVRQEGLTREYAPLAYPATADFEITKALSDSVKNLNLTAHVGVVQSKDSFYSQHSPNSMPVSTMLNNDWQAYKKLGVLASEMEIAALFVVAATRNVKCGAILNVLWNQELSEETFEPKGNIQQVFECALNAFSIL